MDWCTVDEDSEEERCVPVEWKRPIIVEFVNFYVATAIDVFTRGPAPLGTMSTELAHAVELHSQRGLEMLRSLPGSLKGCRVDLMRASFLMGMVSWEDREEDLRFCLIPFKPMVEEVLRRDDPTTGFYTCFPGSQDQTPITCTLTCTQTESDMESDL
ncbi:hypothetical protein KIPB_010166 [Kipferlia bialata]|uniref:Uncharacterized protein n=1 Tax=Kipferlia bialata TaxID=797122 RepID=A0A9K3D629_9EUKA|nr:hypothetical protein KIPB_010166 [Kipferlia bialata]|eukprot:g10166.t1